jgi:hypothetical protein
MYDTFNPKALVTTTQNEMKNTESDKSFPNLSDNVSQIQP